MNETKISKNDTGIAGEFYTAYVLAKNGFKVNISLGRTEGFDLFVRSPNGINITVSVKTTYSSSSKFLLMNKKAESIIDDYLYYAFVRLNAPKGTPEYWIVPSTVVARVIKQSHETWLKTPGRKGRLHRDTTMRSFHIVSHEYYPEDWEDQLENFKENLSLLMDLE